MVGEHFGEMGLLGITGYFRFLRRIGDPRKRLVGCLVLAVAAQVLFVLGLGRGMDVLLFGLVFQLVLPGALVYLTYRASVTEWLEDGQVS